MEGRVVQGGVVFVQYTFVNKVVQELSMGGEVGR